MSPIPFDRVIRGIDTDTFGQGMSPTVTNDELADIHPKQFKVYRLTDSGEFGDAKDYMIALEGEWVNASTNARLDVGETLTLEVNDLVVTGNLTVEGEAE